MSEICEKYDLEYWVWTPAEFDLSDADRRKEELRWHEELYKDCPRLNGVFFPGGDPGHNPPDLVLPFLEDLAELLGKYHPQAKVWLSLQWFNARQVDEIYRYIHEEKPDWLGGLVAGPGSPPIPETRRRLHPDYRLRHYPDITHTVRCQYPVPWWDPAFAFTLGREPINPRPIFYSYVHNALAPYTDGFITYSDGVHDDVNKVVWSALGWNPEARVSDVLSDYARIFLQAADEDAPWFADWFLALERNWEGPLEQKAFTKQLYFDVLGEFDEDDLLLSNWRFLMIAVRAGYDLYLREKHRIDSLKETHANRVLLQCASRGADPVIDDALDILRGDADGRTREIPYWFVHVMRSGVERHCQLLFKTIGLQTSVEKHQASEPERGAILDFLDHPLNNRWWLEDEFEKVRRMKTEEEKVARLLEIANWETPGPGSFYDDIGNVAKSPHVIRGEGINTDPTMARNPNPDVMWWDQGRSRQRQSWITYMMWPLGLRYQGLDPAADYVVRTTGYGQCRLRIDGERVTPTLDGREIGEIKEFPVPRQHLEDRELVLTFDRPADEGLLNWRHKSRLTEVWLIRRGDPTGATQPD